MEHRDLQRVDTTTQTVKRLGTLFQPVVAAPAAQGDSVPVEDPTQALELERSNVLERAREAGHAEGMRAAEERIRVAVDAARRECEAANADALEELEQARTRMAEWLRRLQGMVDAIEDDALEVAAELAYAALLRVLGEAPAHERMLAMCRQALHEQHQRPVVVRVAPADLEALASLAEGVAVRVEGDTRLQPGQCQLDTGLGIHDTGLDVRLDQLRQAFLRGIATVRTTA